MVPVFIISFRTVIKILTKLFIKTTFALTQTLINKNDIFVIMFDFSFFSAKMKAKDIKGK
ncbi:hypothetical protein SG66_21535 [Enterobacter asburiae]|nr:hypothetical protein SG67_20440 [Enterobacter asburiae]KJX05603.1 hypothetical protein SG66_21535 [Enterobacter asburiae]